MSVHKTVADIQTRLAAITSQDSKQEVLSMLKTLQDQEMTFDILSSSQIDMTINKLLYTCEDEEVLSIVKSLARKWKRLPAEFDNEGTSAAVGPIPGDDDDKPQGDDSINHPIESVLNFTVVERPFDASKLMAFASPKASPSVKPIKKSLFAKGSVGSDRSRKSLFARIFDANTNSEDSSKLSVTKVEVEDASGSKDNTIGDSIHPYLQGMTEAEILAEQKKLIERLDPKLVEFVRSRKKGTASGESSHDTPTPLSSDPTVYMQLMEDIVDDKMETEIDSSIDVLNLPINPKTVKGIPGMDKLEMDKLEWTGLVKENRPIYKLQKGDIARFDFEGVLLSGSDAGDNFSTFDRGLHHHGKEMGKPGYSMEELLTLSRSVNHQKILGLQIIGKIYAKAHTGMYDVVFEKSLFELSECMDFVYSIRKALDEFDKTLVNEAIQCLASIIYPWEEEACLDMVYSWEFSKPHPWISTKSSNMNTILEPGDQERDMKDFEILQMDLLEFLIHRSNLLNRLTYFLKLDSLSENGVLHVLKILCRVARHSPNTLIEHDELLSILVTHYTTPNWSNSGYSPSLRGTPLWMVFKILRILVDSSARNACKIFNNFKVFPNVMAFLAHDDWNSNSIVKMPEQIIIECFRLWIAFISQGYAVDEYRNFFPILMKFLVLYQTIELSAFDLIHSGYVFSLLLAILTMQEDSVGIKKEDKHSHWTLVKDCVSCIENVMTKLLTIVSSPESDLTYDKGIIFWALSKGLLLLTESSKYDIGCITEGFVTAFKNFVCCKLFQELTSDLRKHSVILNPPTVGNRYHANFASVNAIRNNGNLNPVIVFGNSLPFLTAIFSVANVLTDKIELCVLLNDNVGQYANDLCYASDNKLLPTEFFVRFELAFILRLLELYPKDCPEKFNLAYKAASQAPKCCSRLFNELFKVAIWSSCDLGDLKMCYKIYSGYLIESDECPATATEKKKGDEEVPIKKVKFSKDVKTEDGSSKVQLDFKHWTERSVGAHWILEPMLRIHTIVTSVPFFLEKNLTEIELQCKVCLQLIGKCLQEHVDFIIQTPKDLVDVYYAVTQIFLLGDPGIYIDEYVSAIMIQILEPLLTCRVLKKWGTKPIFSVQGDVEGSSKKFSDLYRDLVKEYSENSYFNVVFAAFLMIPLRLQEDARLRSNFWIMETLQFLKVPRPLPLVPMEYLTSGLEKDFSMLKIYSRLLLSGKISKLNNPFLFEVIRKNLQNGLSLGEFEDEEFAQLKAHFKKLKI